jgi:hypothetical protein
VFNPSCAIISDPSYNGGDSAQQFNHDIMSIDSILKYPMSKYSARSTHRSFDYDFEDDEAIPLQMRPGSIQLPVDDRFDS